MEDREAVTPGKKFPRRKVEKYFRKLQKNGTELYVCFWQKPDCMEVALTNNGAVPKEKITEGGGLSMLRQRTEEAGGKMEVQSIPRFKLMLSLPEQEEAAYESDDR